MTVPSSNSFPTITPVTWLPAKDVLGGEASDFTPWLKESDNLEILGQALKLDDLTAVAVEHNVLGKKLDILATALDENGEEVPVCIENQYGMSDADHLGRLIAYLAQHERGRAVWIVEQAHDAYVAGVRFLNRTSTDEVGYYLVRVLFTHGAGGAYQVHYDVVAAPIAWERVGSKSGTHHALNEAKVDYLEAIHTLVRPALLSASFQSLNTHARGAYLWVRWPSLLWFRKYSRRLDIRVTKHDAVVALYVTAFKSNTANEAVAELLRDYYGSRVEEIMPAGSVINWDVVGKGQRKAIRVDLPGAGYAEGDAEEASTWALAVCTSWLELIKSDPIHDLDARIEAALPGMANAEPESDDGDYEDSL